MPKDSLCNDFYEQKPLNPNYTRIIRPSLESQSAARTPTIEMMVFAACICFLQAIWVALSLVLSDRHWKIKIELYFPSQHSRWGKNRSTRFLNPARSTIRSRSQDWSISDQIWGDRFNLETKLQVPSFLDFLFSSKFWIFYCLKKRSFILWDCF